MSTIHHTDSMHLQQGVWFLLVLIWPLLCAMFLIVLVKSGCSVRRFGHTGLSMSFIPFPLTDSIHSGLFKTCLKLDIQAAAGLPAPDMLPCDRSCIAQYYTDCSINKIHGKRTLNESRMCESMFFFLIIPLESLFAVVVPRGSFPCIQVFRTYVRDPARAPGLHPRSCPASDQAERLRVGALGQTLRYFVEILILLAAPSHDRILLVNLGQKSQFRLRFP